MLKTEEIHWYPMRVTYSREMLAKAYLDSIGVESFIPMRYVPIKGKHPRHRELKPAITSLIFIRSCQKDITELKMTKRELNSLRYIMTPVLDDNNNVIRRDILTVPDKQMDNFIKVASVNDDRIFYMENLDFAGKPGQRVKVVEGDFAGVEGTIKRVKKNKCVVVQIENVAAVAIAFLPAAFLLPIEEEENK
jgi:KOW motif./Transcription termination factor nusG.